MHLLQLLCAAYLLDLVTRFPGHHISEILSRALHVRANDVACCAAQVGAITGSKILRIMKGLGLAPEIPEDLYHLIKKAVSMRKHLELFRKDKDGKFRLILVESRIHRLARYYKVPQRLPSPFLVCGL